MATSNDKYYMEMCNILTDYNDLNYAPLYNAKIWEGIRKFMEEE